MATQSDEAINWSVRLYQLLLWLYPVEHRRVYGPLMAQVFRDQCRATYQQTGAIGVLTMWLPLLGDLAITVIEERRQRILTMNTTIFSRFSGRFLMLGGVLFALSGISQLQPGSHYNFWGIYQLSISALIPGFLLIGCGLFGVYRRYQPRFNLLARLTLILMTSGAVGSGLGWVSMPIIGETGWAIFGISALIHFFSSILFGIVAMRRSLLPRWNFLPLFIGAVPLVFFAVVQAAGENRGFGVLWGDFVIIASIGLCWATLGYGIFKDRLSQSQSVTA